MNRRLLSSMSLVLLLAAMLGLVTSTISNNISLIASTDDEGGENGDGNGNGNGNGDSNDEPETEPEPEPEPEPVEPETPVEPILPEAAVVEPEPIECPEGTVLSDIDTCVTTSASASDPKAAVQQLLPCDGSAQDCITENGDICLEGQGGHECECAEDMSDCPNHPSLEEEQPPITPKPLPYCDQVSDDYTGSCHDRKDFDDITGLYPCNDGTQEEDWRDCEDASTPLDPSPSPSPSPEPPTDDNQTDPGDGNGTDVDIDIDVIIKNINEKHEKTIIKKSSVHDRTAFPEIDIIGLSIKDNGDSMICLINIDDEHVQCQEFGVTGDRVDEDISRIIEVDTSKEYDNGNTGSSDIDDVIQYINDQDFSELEDADNHEFNDVDLAALGINPKGEGLVCIMEDSDTGKALCEPFKIAETAVSGQITEIVEFT